MKETLSFHEIMPQDVWKWKYMENQIEQVLCLYNYEEIRLSILQDYEILQKGINALMDSSEAERVTERLLVLKQPDQDINLLSLRPEGTINVLHHIVNQLKDSKIHRVFYHGPMFIRNINDKPTEFYQLGVELLGSDSILSENEVISLGMKICSQLGLKDTWLEINSFGCSLCRQQFFQAMRNYLETNKDKYCETCYRDLFSNPLHVDTNCNDSNCQFVAQSSPKVSDYICPKCKANFGRIKKIQANLGNAYKVNNHLFKNFSYYNETVFNLMVQTNGTAELIGGGGRYDYLSEQVTGKQIPAVGFYLNLDAIFHILSKRELFHKPELPFRVYISSQSEDMEIILLQIVQELHQAGISTLISSDIRNMKSDMQAATESQCHGMVILRSDNIRDGKVLLKNLVKNSQEYLKLADLLPEIDLIRKSVQFSI